jgi:IS605 OrfB family transposase
MSYRTSEESVSLSTMNGRIHIPLLLGDYQRERLKDKKLDYATVQKKNKAWFIHFVVDVPDKEIPEPKRVLGVDRGIYNIAVTSTGKFFGGRHAMELRKRFESLRSRLQRKGTKNAKRHLKRLSGKEARRTAQANHTISKRLVAMAVDTQSAIAIENLKGIRKRCGDKGKARKKHRKNMARWSFYQLEQFIAYKAAIAGVALIKVTPYHTSQQCSKCGLLGHRKGAHFSCVCGYRASADSNASSVISKRVKSYLGLVRAALNQPPSALRAAA